MIVDSVDRSNRRGGFLLNRVARAMAKTFEASMKDEGLGDIGSGEGRFVYSGFRGWSGKA